MFNEQKNAILMQIVPSSILHSVFTKGLLNMYLCMGSGTIDQPTRAHAFGIPADFVGANDMIEE